MPKLIFLGQYQKERKTENPCEYKKSPRLLRQRDKGGGIKILWQRQR